MSYTATASRALALMKRKGGTITFPGAIPGTAGVYDAATDTWSGGTPATDATGSAVQIEGDPDKLAALSLTLVRSVTLIVAASGLLCTPSPNMTFVWAGTTWTVRSSDPTDPSGSTPIIYEIVGSV